MLSLLACEVAGLLKALVEARRRAVPNIVSAIDTDNKFWLQNNEFKIKIPKLTLLVSSPETKHFYFVLKSRGGL